jgi:pyridoxal phosphate enzyme (YggS family)
MSELTKRIAENVARVRERIAEASRRAGRDPREVTLVAVTKYVGPTEVRALIQAGCTVLGESRPQQLFTKAEALRDEPIRWHMIGHLQRNKVRRTLPLVEMIESADSMRLIAAMDRIGAELGLGGTGVSPVPRQKHGQDARATHRVAILLEVNVSGEAAKHGFRPEAIEPLLEELAGYRHVEVRGLMCMAGLEGGPGVACHDAARRDFAELRRLRDRLAANCPEGIEPAELSMGMSRDYEVAIDEGATIVRVGSALFEGVLG